MIKDHIHIADLLHKERLGVELSSEEVLELEAWKNSSPSAKQLYEENRESRFTNHDYQAYFLAGNARQSWEKIVSRTGWRSGEKIRRLRIFRYAALLALFLGAGSIWF